VISSGGVTYEAVEFTDESFHRLTVTVNEVERIVIDKPVNSGAAPDFCGAFTMDCTREGFCDYFLPSVTYWGFRTGCSMGMFENISLEYRVSSRATQGTGHHGHQVRSLGEPHQTANVLHCPGCVGVHH